MFKVDIDSPFAGAAEFVILKSLFDLTVQHKWSLGDQCKVIVVLLLTRLNKILTLTSGLTYHLNAFRPSFG